MLFCFPVYYAVSSKWFLTGNSIRTYKFRASRSLKKTSHFQLTTQGQQDFNGEKCQSLSTTYPALTKTLLDQTQTLEPRKI